MDSDKLISRDDKPLVGENFPALDEGFIMTGSTDVGDLSLVAPVSMLQTACYATGSPGHSWGNVATGFAGAVNGDTEAVVGDP